MRLPLPLQNRCRLGRSCMRSSRKNWSRCQPRKRGRLLHLWWQCRACNSCTLLHATKGQFDRKGIVSTCNYYSKSRSLASNRSMKLPRLVQSRFQANNPCRTNPPYKSNLCSTENIVFHQRRVCWRDKWCKHQVMDIVRGCTMRHSNRNNAVKQGR